MAVIDCLIEMEIDDQGQMIAGAPREVIAHDACVPNKNCAAAKSFIERTERQISGKRAEARDWRRDLLKTVVA
jgi:hypothetical protein